MVRYSHRDYEEYARNNGIKGENMPTKTKNDSQWGEKINTNVEFRKTSALEDGQSIEGTILAFKESSKFPGNMNLIMKGLDGVTFTLAPSGNLKYAIKDGLLKIGSTYKFQREGTRKVSGKDSSMFGIYPSKNNVETATGASDDI